MYLVKLHSCKHINNPPQNKIITILGVAPTHAASQIKICVHTRAPMRANAKSSGKDLLFLFMHDQNAEESPLKYGLINCVLYYIQGIQFKIFMYVDIYGKREKETKAFRLSLQA